MPIYVHRCPKCDTEVEKLMKLSEPAPTCPKDGEPMQKQLTSSFKFQFTNKLCKGTDGGNLMQ